MRLVSVAFCEEYGVPESIWLLDNPEGAKEAREKISELCAAGAVFLCYSAVAEGRSLLELFGGPEHLPSDLKLYDLHAEVLAMQNLGPLKAAFGGRTSLANACKILLGVEIDAARKKAVRELIIACNSGRESDLFELKAAKAEVLEYNESDLEYLFALRERIERLYLTRIFSIGDEAASDLYKRRALSRGRFGLATARMERLGYPIDFVGLTAYTHRLPSLKYAAAEECLSYLPGSFTFKKGVPVKNTKAIRAWVSSNDAAFGWPETDKGELSLAKSNFAAIAKEDEASFAGAFLRYLEVEAQAKAFSPNAARPFFSYMGADRRIRAAAQPYGQQGSRSSPNASGFLKAKSRWLSYFMQARPGSALLEIDYAAQEVLLAALLSNDANLLKAYVSGDIYLSFGIESGLIKEKNATKKTHGAIRDSLKRFLLSAIYGAGAVSVMKTLKVPRETADEYLLGFRRTYPQYVAWRERVGAVYRDQGQISLPDGWPLWKFLPKKGEEQKTGILSAQNFPVQGRGAIVLREAVSLAHKEGLKVLYTFHDAIGIELSSSNPEPEIKALVRAMTKGFRVALSERDRGNFPDIELEGILWGPDFEDRGEKLRYDEFPNLREISVHKRFPVSDKIKTLLGV
jgi:hypothetical protein